MTLQGFSDSKIVTAADIAQTIETEIRDGLYAGGDQLPTVRELATQMGVNKNTVVRAYQALQRKGYLELIRGSGAFVRQLEPEESFKVSQTRSQLDQLLTEMKQWGLSREVALQETLRSLQRVYKSNLQLAFVECNAQDVEVLRSELGSLVGYPMEGILLADLLAAPEAVMARYHLIVTTFYHLREVSQALGANGEQKLIGVNALPAPDALLKIARLPGSVIGLVCELSSTMESLTHIIHVYHPSVTILSALITDQSRLQTLLDKADAIVVTQSCYRWLIEQKPEISAITVSFTIDKQSTDFLLQRIQEEEQVIQPSHT